MNVYTATIMWVFALFLLLILVFYFVFWLWMLSDLVHKKFKKRALMLEWFFAVIFLPVIGPVLYYYLIKKKLKKGR